MTPFRVYYGQKSNFVQKVTVEWEMKTLKHCNECLPQLKDKNIVGSVNEIFKKDVVSLQGDATVGFCRKIWELMTKSTEVKSKTRKAWFLKEQDVENDYDPDGNGNC